MAPERPSAPIGARNARADARRGLGGDQRGGHLRRLRSEDAQGGGGGSQDVRGEAAPAEGGEHAEREHVHLDGGWGRRA